MVNLTFWLLLGMPLAVDADVTYVPEVSPTVRPALRSGAYPWYDASSDSVKPLWPPQKNSYAWLDRWLDRLKFLGRLRFGGLNPGELIITGLVILALSVLLVVITELWRRYRPVAGQEEPGGTLVGTAQVQTSHLPVGVRPESEDPWQDAIRFRESGDYANAIICLFAHQLLTLQRLRVVRLAPGRTGRQLARTIDDPRFRRPIDSTLRLFEAVYYGHLVPTAEAFESVWVQAEDFERQVAEGVAP